MRPFKLHFQKAWEVGDPCFSPCPAWFSAGIWTWFFHIPSECPNHKAISCSGVGFFLTFILMRNSILDLRKPSRLNFHGNWYISVQHFSLDKNDTFGQKKICWNIFVEIQLTEINSTASLFYIKSIALGNWGIPAHVIVQPEFQISTFCWPHTVLIIQKAVVCCF